MNCEGCGPGKNSRAFEPLVLSNAVSTQFRCDLLLLSYGQLAQIYKYRLGVLHMNSTVLCLGMEFAHATPCYDHMYQTPIK